MPGVLLPALKNGDPCPVCATPLMRRGGSTVFCRICNVSYPLDRELPNAETIRYARYADQMLAARDRYNNPLPIIPIPDKTP